MTVRVDPQRLIRLGELIKQGSFRRAADSLGITQSALSQSIAQMEGEVGVRLIDRTPHGVVPTPYGQALAEHARAIEWQLTEAAQKISELAFGHKGVLAIGGTSGGAISILAQSICALQKAQPAIRTRLIEETWSTALLAQINERTLDVAVCHRPADIELEGKIALPLFQARRLLCVRAGHPMVDNLSLAAVAGFPFACPGGEMGIHLDIRRIFNALQIDFPQEQVLMSNSLSAAKEIVFNSDAFAIFSDLSILHEQKEGSLKVSPLGTLSEYWYYLVVREDHVTSDLLVSFMNSLSEVCREHDITLHPEIARLRKGRPLRGVMPRTAAEGM